MLWLAGNKARMFPLPHLHKVMMFWIMVGYCLKLFVFSYWRCRMDHIVSLCFYYAQRCSRVDTGWLDWFGAINVTNLDLPSILYISCCYCLHLIASNRTVRIPNSTVKHSQPLKSKRNSNAGWTLYFVLACKLLPSPSRPCKQLLEFLAAKRHHVG